MVRNLMLNKMGAYAISINVVSLKIGIYKPDRKLLVPYTTKIIQQHF